MSKVILYNDECIHSMNELGDRTINLILTDPPYNLGNFMISRDTNLKKMRDNFFGTAGWDNLEYDAWCQAMDRFFEQAARVMVVGGAMIVFMAVAKLLEASNLLASSRLCLFGFNRLKAIGRRISPPIACKNGIVRRYVAISVMRARMITAPAVPT